VDLSEGVVLSGTAELGVALQSPVLDFISAVAAQLRGLDYVFLFAWLAVLAAAVRFLFVKRRRTHPEADVDATKLHFRYIVGILVALLILVATFKWTELKDFTTYLSNVATFTSLALALVAIIISLIAGDTVSKTLGSISQITTEVRNAIGQTAGLLTSAVQAAEDSRVKNSELGSLISDLRTEFSALRATSETLATTTKNIGTEVASLPSRFDRLESKLADAAPKELPQPKGASQQQVAALSAETLSSFLARASTAGLFALFAIVLAKKRDKAVALKDLEKYPPAGEVDYMYGFLVCCIAFEIVRTERKTSPSNIKVTYIHPYIEEHIRERLTRDFQRYKDDSQGKLYPTYVAALDDLEKAA
jgi:uncharacterized protein YoxC